jgi:hypothetical protein
MNRQYVQCKFSDTDSRVYTYHQDLAEGVTVLKAGDTAKVADPRGGWKRVKVVGITSTKPSFPTKPAELYVPPPADNLEAPANQTANGDSDGFGFDD